MDLASDTTAAREPSLPNRPAMSPEQTDNVLVALSAGCRESRTHAYSPSDCGASAPPQREG